MPATNIQEVVDQLETIISTCEREQSPLGYFAALYHKVTVTVRDKIGTGYFDDDVRMEHLDVVFANRYLEAYAAYQASAPTSACWVAAFDAGQQQEWIVLQHLLLGMNAHISYDLGIAAATISTPENLADLQDDFNKINELLASLVHQVEAELAAIWPVLRWLLRLTSRVDDFLVNFSMTLARDGAWRFTQAVINATDQGRTELFAARDQKVTAATRFIINHSWLEGWIFWLVRRFEKGTVKEKINVLRAG